MSFFHKIKPTVSKRNLLLVAGCAWTIAGGILITRGLYSIVTLHHHIWIELLTGLVLGLIFYFLLFSRISSKHIFRIKTISVEDPCFFSFFNLRSYLLMAVMIVTGITLRKLNVVNPDLMYTFYLTMGIPLLISALRFFVSWLKNSPVQ